MERQTVAAAAVRISDREAVRGSGGLEAVCGACVPCRAPLGGVGEGRARREHVNVCGGGRRV